MADPIGPGDWVECIIIDETPRLPGEFSFIVGGIYRVENVGVWRGEPWLSVVGKPSRHPTRGYLARAFRPIYRRRDAEALTAKLLVGARAKGPLVPAQVEREGSRETVK